MIFIVLWISTIANNPIIEQAILANGGKKEMEDGKAIYW